MKILKIKINKNTKKKQNTFKIIAGELRLTILKSFDNSDS